MEAGTGDVQKMLNYIAGSCKGPAKGRGRLPKDIFTEALGVHRRELCTLSYHWFSELVWAKAELNNWDSNGGTDAVPLGIAVVLYQEIVWARMQ